MSRFRLHTLYLGNDAEALSAVDNWFL